MFCGFCKNTGACVEAAGTDQHQGNRVFFVQEEHLTKLLTVSHTCLAPCKQVDVECNGTVVHVHTECFAGHHFIWQNQHIYRQQPVLNLELCATVLFSGNKPTSCLRMLASIGVQVVSERTFFALQRSYLSRLHNNCRAIFLKDKYTMFSAYRFGELSSNVCSRKPVEGRLLWQGMDEQSPQGTVPSSAHTHC